VSDSSDMLKRLEPAVRPGAVGDRSEDVAFGGVQSSAAKTFADSLESTSIEHLSFGDLVDLMESGKLGVGQPVHVSDDVELDESERTALVQAADHAQAAGSRRAVVLLGSRSFLLDVAARRVEQPLEVDPESDWPNVVTGVDAVVVQPGSVDGEDGETVEREGPQVASDSPLSLLGGLDGPCVVRLSQADHSEMDRQAGVSR